MTAWAGCLQGGICKLPACGLPPPRSLPHRTTACLWPASARISPPPHLDQQAHARMHPALPNIKVLLIRRHHLHLTGKGTKVRGRQKWGQQPPKACLKTPTGKLCRCMKICWPMPTQQATKQPRATNFNCHDLLRSARALSCALHATSHHLACEPPLSSCMHPSSMQPPSHPRPPARNA